GADQPSTPRRPGAHPAPTQMDQCGLVALRRRLIFRRYAGPDAAGVCPGLASDLLSDEIPDATSAVSSLLEEDIRPHSEEPPIRGCGDLLWRSGSTGPGTAARGSPAPATGAILAAGPLGRRRIANRPPAHETSGLSGPRRDDMIDEKVNAHGT